MREVIRFYSKTLNPKYFPFSNFYHAPFEDKMGDVWLTTEHYFQAMKFLPGTVDDKGRDIRKLIRYANTPKIAVELGRDRVFPLRKDWEKLAFPNGIGIGYNFTNDFLVKDVYMYNALRYKFTQHEELKQLLIETNDAEIIEASPIDFYWGEGEDGSGKNTLGKLLMQLREELK